MNREKRFKILRKKLNRSLDLLNKRATKQLSLETLYDYIIIYAFKSRLQILKQNYFKSVWFLEESVDYIEKSLGDESEYPPLYLTSGLYLYFMNFAVNNYSYISPYVFFMPDGNKTKGLRYLKKATKSPLPFIQTEAHYFLLKIYLETEQQYNKGIKHAEILVNHYKDNVMYRWLYYRLLIKTDSEKAKQVRADLKKLIRHHTYLKEQQKNYWLDKIQNYP